jgi:hypothetical protein
MAKLSNGFERHRQSAAEWGLLAAIAIGALTFAGAIAFYIFKM